MWLALFLLPAIAGFAIYDAFDDDDDDNDTSDDSGTVPSEPTPDEDEGDGAETPDVSRTLGNDNNNFIMDLGEEGDTNIFAYGGNDVVIAGGGDDRIFLGDGDDVALGANFGGLPEGTLGDYMDNPSLETLSPALEDRYMDTTLDAGNDLIRGGNGNDIIFDYSGANTVHGELGNDIIDTRDLTGGRYAGPLEIDDEADPDNVTGGYGNDALLVDDGDVVSGGQGRDLFDVYRNSDADEDVVTITDFAPEEDRLEINWLDISTRGTSLPDNLSNESTTASDVIATETPDGVLLSYSGVSMVLLENLTLDDLPDDFAVDLFLPEYI